jgi:hypothetical protein
MTVIGTARTAEGGSFSPGRLQEVGINHIYETCNDLYDLVPDGGEDICKGNSGGPKARCWTDWIDATISELLTSTPTLCGGRLAGRRRR